MCYLGNPLLAPTVWSCLQAKLAAWLLAHMLLVRQWFSGGTRLQTRNKAAATCFAVTVSVAVLHDISLSKPIQLKRPRLDLEYAPRLPGEGCACLTAFADDYRRLCVF